MHVHTHGHICPEGVVASLDWARWLVRQSGASGSSCWDSQLDSVRGSLTVAPKKRWPCQLPERQPAVETATRVGATFVLRTCTLLGQ